MTQPSSDGSRLCVVGVGYVGLTLAVVLAQQGFRVTAVDANPAVVDGICRFEPQFHEPGLVPALRRYLNNGLVVTEQMPTEHQDAYVVCVGTPWDKTASKPVLDYTERATRQVADVLTPGALVILRSTVPVGTTRGVVLPILSEKASEVHLAFCPERTAEGVALQELYTLPQVIGALDERSLDLAQGIFQRVTHTLVRVSSLESAEAIKLIDNSYRDLSFAFANEIAYLAEAIGLDAAELIRSGGMGYSRTNVAGVGYVGGVCITKDPHILVHSGKSRGFTPTLVERARAVNETLPSHTVDRVEAMLDERGKKLLGAKVLIAGLAFKGAPETDDLRDSQAIVTAGILRERGASVYAQDYVVGDEALEVSGVTPCTLEEGFAGADAVIFMNNHRAYTLIDLPNLAVSMNRPSVIYDGWRLFDRRLLEGVDSVYYGGLGVG